MVKKLSMIVLGAVVVSFCMATMPEKADATKVRIYGKHKHRWERGEAWLWGQYDEASKGFTTRFSKRYRVRLKVLGGDSYTASVRGKCGASKQAGPC